MCHELIGTVKSDRVTEPLGTTGFSTELAESQTGDQTIMSIAGRVSPKMLAAYSHIRMNAKRKALDALPGGGFGGVVMAQTTAQVSPKPTSVIRK